MYTIIYRKSDRQIIGECHPPQPLDVEMWNILNSELGGNSSDYGTVQVAERQPGKAVLNADDTISFVPRPSISPTQRELDLGVKLENDTITIAELKEWAKLVARRRRRL